MTVATLIKLLKTVPAETPVLIGHETGVDPYEPENFKLSYNVYVFSYTDTSLGPGKYKCVYNDIPVALVFDGS